MWGDNRHGQLDVPENPVGCTVVQITSGIHCSLALLDNGELLAWGKNENEHTDVPNEIFQVPSLGVLTKSAYKTY